MDSFNFHISCFLGQKLFPLTGLVNGAWMASNQQGVKHNRQKEFLAFIKPFPLNGSVLCSAQNVTVGGVLSFVENI